MKSFFYGLSGFFVGLVLYLSVLPLYSDYRAKAETEGLVFKMEASQRLLEVIFQKTGKFDSAVPSKTTANANDPKPLIFDNGTIIVKGNVEGQLLLLIPAIEGGAVRWRCYVGPENATPKNCRSN